MKGEILRRMSMEIKEETLERVRSKQDQEKDKNDEDDYLVKTIGHFGLWQALVTITVILSRAIAVWNIMSIFFLTPVVEFVCVEFSDNVTFDVMNSTCYTNCTKYDYTNHMGRSIVEEFGLICQKAWLANFTQPVFMFGLLVGAFIFGWISDRFGRRTAMLLSTFLSGVFMIALPYSHTYSIFTSIRFMIGLVSGGSLLICVVQIMEIIGKQYREVGGAFCLILDGFAEASLAGFAFYTSNWLGYTLSYGIATCFIFILILFVPESPRWLVTHGKVDEAVKVITRAANRNKLNTSNIKSEITKAVEDLKLNKSEIAKMPYLEFVTSKELFIMTLKVFIMWLSLGLCCCGIYQYATKIEFDPYLSFIILGCAQIPFFPMSILLSWRFGRKYSIIGITGAIAVAMLVLTFVPKGYWPRTMLTILVIICFNVSFSIAYIHVCELYPTPIRNMSLAFSVGGASIGVIIAHFVANLTPRWLPSLIFFVVPIISGLCYFTLPETKGRNLKDTIKK